MSELLIPVINEAFSTDYPMDERIIHLPNDYIEKFGEIISDTVFRIGNVLYHIECQSEKDGIMIIRMFEYDMSIALEDAIRKGKPYRLKFPRSCVIYIRFGDPVLREEKIMVEFPDGQVAYYTVNVFELRAYSIEELFEKKLFMLLPFYILRYEAEIRNAEKKGKEISLKIIKDLEKINTLLAGLLDDEKTTKYYTDLVEYIRNVIGHMVKSEDNRERMYKIMGGEILELASERLMRLGREEGIEEERANTERERARADAAESRVLDAESRAFDAESQVNYMEAALLNAEAEMNLLKKELAELKNRDNRNS